MRYISRLVCLAALLLLVACGTTEVVEVTRVIESVAEVTVEVPVTQVVEVTRVVPEIVTVVVFPTAAPASPTPEATATLEPTAAPTLPPQPTLPPARSYSSADVIAAFQAAGLEVGDTSVIPTDDPGPVPNSYVEATRFLIPSLGPDSGGRVFSFASVGERDMVLEYYQNLPLAGFTTWVTADGLLVLQINNQLPRERWLEYVAVFEGLQ